MTEKDWELLIALFEEKTITKAAEKMYISQPALTYRMKQIEQKFNTQIIHRGSKGVIFTSQGEYLVQHAKKTLKELELAKNHINNMKSTVEGVLKIGVSSTFALHKFPTLLKGFITKYPNAEIKLITGWSTGILKSLQSEDIHVAIIRGKHGWHDHSVLLDTEALSIASKTPINLEELPYMNFIHYDTDPYLQSTYRDWWKQTFATPPKITMNVDGIETCIKLIKMELGFSILPSICLTNNEELRQMDLEINNQKLIRETHLLYRSELENLKIVEAFIEFVKNYYQINLENHKQRDY